MGKDSLYFCGPKAGELEPEEEDTVGGFMLIGVFWSMMEAGKELGGCGWDVVFAMLWSGDAGRRLRDDERENEEWMGSGEGCDSGACPRGVMSSSLSSCIDSMAVLPLVELSNQLGDRGGRERSSGVLNGLRGRIGL